MFEQTMRNLPTAPGKAFSTMLNAISDYTNDRLPWEPTGPDTTYITVIRIDELTQLYAVPNEEIRDSQRAALGLADGTYLPVYLPDESVPPGVLGKGAAVAGGEHAAAALRVVSWLEGMGDLTIFLQVAEETDRPDWLPNVADLALDGGIWSEYFAASFNPQEMKDYELNLGLLNGKPTAFVRIAMESLESD